MLGWLSEWRLGTPRASILNTNPATQIPSCSLLTYTHCATQSIAHEIDLEGWCVGERCPISLRPRRGEKEGEETRLESWGLCSDGVCMHDGQAVAFAGKLVDNPSCLAPPAHTAIRNSSKVEATQLSVASAAHMMKSLGRHQTASWRPSYMLRRHPMPDVNSLPCAKLARACA